MSVRVWQRWHVDGNVDTGKYVEQEEDDDEWMEGDEDSLDWTEDDEDEGFDEYGYYNDQQTAEEAEKRVAIWRLKQQLRNEGMAMWQSRIEERPWTSQHATKSELQRSWATKLPVIARGPRPRTEDGPPAQVTPETSVVIRPVTRLRQAPAALRVQESLSQYRTNNDELRMLHARVKQHRKNRHEAQQRLAHGVDFVRTHKARVDSGLFNHAVLKQIQEHKRAQQSMHRDAVRDVYFDHLRQTGRQLQLRVNARHETVFLRIKRERQMQWLLTVSVCARFGKFCDMLEARLMVRRQIAKQSRAAAVIQRSWRAARLVHSAARLKKGRSVLRQFLGAALAMQRFAKANPRRDAVGVLVKFLTDYGSAGGGLRRVIRRYLFRVRQTQKAFRNYRACTEARLLLLSRRWDLIAKAIADGGRKPGSGPTFLTAGDGDPHLLRIASALTAGTDETVDTVQLLDKNAAIRWQMARGTSGGKRPGSSSSHTPHPPRSVPSSRSMRLAQLSAKRMDSFRERQQRAAREREDSPERGGGRMKLSVPYKMKMQALRSLLRNARRQFVQAYVQDKPRRKMELQRMQLELSTDDAHLMLHSTQQATKHFVELQFLRASQLRTPCPTFLMNMYISDAKIVQCQKEMLARLSRGTDGSNEK